MKTKTFALVTALFAFGTSAHAVEILCSGKTMSSSDPEFKQTVILDASVTTDTLIKSVTTMMQDLNSEPMSFTRKGIKAQEKYNPTSPLYSGYNRFVLASDWTVTSLMLPKNVTKLNKFTAYIQQAGHDSYPVIKLACRWTAK